MTDQHEAGAGIDGRADEYPHAHGSRPRYTVEDYDRGHRNPAEDIFVADRPWGQFEQFVSNEQVTVKIITVQPGHRLSLPPAGRRAPSMSGVARSQPRQLTAVGRPLG